jgi:hypothetical protein
MKNRSMILRASAIRSATRRFYGGRQQRHGGTGHGPAYAKADSYPQRPVKLNRKC